MQKPCQDSYYTLFSSYPMLLDYHEEQAKNSRWIRCKVADLQVEPLGESSPLIGNLSAFAAGTSQEAVKDTAENLGLAMRVNGELYPVRMTAYKSLLDRAKIGGTALPKLSREVLAEVLNECLKLYSADALLLIRDEKISAVHSGDEVDYSVLPIDELLKVLQAKLDARFSENEFESGYCDHSLVSASWRILNEKGYPSPGRLRYERGIITNNNKKGSELPWNRHVLKDLLVNVVYIGNLAQGRSSQCLYKGEKYHWTKEADWDVVEGTHEPIISMELWNKVQEINTKASSDVKKSFGRYAHLPKRPNPYGSVLRCADCGRVMKYVRSYTRPRKDGVVTDYYNYKCPTNIELGDTACSKKSIRADDLDKIMLSVIRKQMDLFLDTQKTLLGLIALEKEKAKHSVPANRVKELQDKLDQKKKLFSRLYIDFKDGILTQQEYLLARDVYQKEIAAYESELQELQAIKTKTKVTETGARKWNRLISRYYKAETVTEEMVEAMVDEIRVNTDGSLDIRFKYMPEFEEMFKECERIRKEVA